MKLVFQPNSHLSFILLDRHFPVSGEVGDIIQSFARPTQVWARYILMGNLILYIVYLDRVYYLHSNILHELQTIF
jgi:hypothetical protein